MTTYTAITAGEVDSDSPITDTLLQRLRDNPIAIAEADATVPAALLNTALLGTMTTTSGSTQTLSSLTLTNYKFLLMVFRNVSTTTVIETFNIGAATNVIAGMITSASNTISGMAWIELSSGLVTTASAMNALDGIVKCGSTGYSTATTSVSFSTSGTFDAGSVRVYGVK